MHCRALIISFVRNNFRKDCMMLLARAMRVHPGLCQSPCASRSSFKAEIEIVERMLPRIITSNNNKANY